MSLRTLFTNIANAIRGKTGETATIKASDFPTAIGSIPSATDHTIKDLFDFKKSCYNEFYNQRTLTYDMLNSILRYSDTENVTKMNGMFYNCSALTTIPQIDTGNNTSTEYMFYGCSALTSIPQLNTSNLIYMGNTFQGCTSLTTIPQLDTSKVTDMNYAFFGCSNLISIPLIDVSNVDNMSSMFSGCTSLKSILMTGMKANFNISASTQFERSDLVTILNNLATVSGKKLTMGATNLAKLTDEDKAIATNKGWTLA